MTRNEDIDNLTVGSQYTDSTNVATQLDIPVYSDDTNAPTETHYFNDSEGALKYKDASGTVHESSGSGDATIGDSISVQNQTGERFAREFPGADLSTKVQNAIDDLPNGRGRIRVTPKEDGTAWDWGSSLTLDLSNYEGLQLDIDNNAAIEYGGSGWCLTANGTDNDVPQTSAPFEITGGHWTMTGDPMGWLQIQDVYMPRVRPGYVECRNSTDDAVAVSVENVDTYSESARIDGHYEADIGIDFLPASVTGGESGTESFHDTHLEGPRINAFTTGIRCRGWMQYSQLTSPTIWLKSEGATALMLDAPRMDGTIITGMKIENVGGFDNAPGITVTDGFDSWYGPLFVGGWNTGSPKVDTSMEGADDFARIMQIEQSQNGFAITDKNNERVARFDGFSGELSLSSVSAEDGASVGGDFSVDGATALNSSLTVSSNSFEPIRLYRGSADTSGLFAVNLDSTVQFRAVSGDDVGAGEDAFIQAAPGAGEPTTIPQDLSVEGAIQREPQDVLAISSPQQGLTAYHDPSINSDGNTEGPAFYDGGGWVSQVDGSTID